METIHPGEQRANRSKYSIADLLLLTSIVGAVLLLVQGMLPDLASDRSSLEAEKLIGLAVVSGLIFLFSYGAVSGETWKSRSASLVVFFLLLLFFGVLSWHQIAWFVLGMVVSAVLSRGNFTKTFQLQLLVGWLLASSLLANLLNHCFPSARVQDLLAARKAYPIEDLSDRLEAVSNRSFDAHLVTDPKISESRLTRELNPFYADKHAGFGRRWALRQIHDREYEAFVRSLGFGQFRMISVSRRRIDLPQIEDIYLDSSERKLENEDRLLTPLLGEGERYEFESASGSLTDLLKRSYLDFFHPATLGWTSSPKNVAGFEPHAFRFPVPQVSIKRKAYSIRRLELIGLLMSDRPRVYVTSHLPRMDQISESEVPTRELNEFEAAALKRLFSGEDLVVDEQQDQIQMVGALRSLESCASCHDSESGDLMGAFSYNLVKR